MTNKILYVVNTSLASQTGGGRTRIISAAKQAGKRGFIVETLCLVPPYQTFLVIRLLIKGKLSLSSELKGKVHYFPRLPLTRLKWVSSLNKWYCGILVYILCRSYKIRVIHCHGIRASLFGLTARRLMNNDIKVVADIHGASMEEYMYEKGLTKPDERAVELGANESNVLTNADWLIFVSEAMQKHYEKKFNKEFSSSAVIPCATESSGKNLNGLRQTLKREYNLEDKLVFCYVGSGETYQLPAQMCQFFKKVLKTFPNAFFLIFSHHKSVFSKQFDDFEIDSKYYKLDAVDHSEIFNALQIGDFGFLLRDDSIVNRVSSPTKFAEYCLSGVPVITTEWVGDISNIVQERKIGLIIDLKTLAVDSELTAFIGDVERNRDEYSRRCFRFAQEEFSWDSYGLKLENIYSLLNENQK